MHFLFDAIGAFLSVLLLMLFYYEFNNFFLLPTKDAKALIAIGFSVLLYSSFTYIFVKSNLKACLMALILFNLFYCCFSFWVLCANYPFLTVFSRIYLIIEVVIVFVVILIERSVLGRLNSST